MREFVFVISSPQEGAIEVYASVLANNAQDAVAILRSQISDMTGDNVGIQIPTADDRITRFMVGINTAKISEDDITDIEDEAGLQWDGEEISATSGRLESREERMEDRPEPGDVPAADRFTLAAKRRQVRWEPKRSVTPRALEFRVADKGGVSVYGLNRFPTTLYYEQWSKLLDVEDELRHFLEENKSQLKIKRS